ncbi:MAG: DUF2301 domain-containing membrane protein [Cyanobacteriota bacterium]|nr:DUF2301 domain-containing membrane protein [Cyanobacteriota bacterium]
MSASLAPQGQPSADPVYEGMFGTYTITDADRREVLGYRLALTSVAVAQVALAVQWWRWGSAALWPWLVVMAVGLGLALRWIHIYLRPLHQALGLFWLLGCVGLVAVAANLGLEAMVREALSRPLALLAVGPFFAALTGIGFKEFFCFRRPEAIGVTLLLPVALLGRLTGLLPLSLTLQLLALQAVLLTVLCLRKFPMAAAADVGDKSVFHHLERQRHQPTGAEATL